MSFDLAFWHEDQRITAKQAVQVYWQLCDGNDAVVKPHQNIALFLQKLTQQYPSLGDYPEEKLEECPWSCDFSLTPGSVILCMAWPHGRELAPLLIQMASEHDLVCYNPQRDEVYLPPSLAMPRPSQRIFSPSFSLLTEGRFHETPHLCAPTQRGRTPPP